MSSHRDNLLIEDHSQLDKLLEEIIAAIQKGDGPHAFAKLDYFWARLAMHIRAEHLHLFPALLETAFRKSADDEKRNEDATSIEIIESVIEQLRADHNFFMSELAGTIETMRLMLEDQNGGLRDNILEVRKRLQNVGSRLSTHNKIEEAHVYPLVDLSLSPDAAARIRSKMKMELDNLPPRFFENANPKVDKTS